MPLLRRAAQSLLTSWAPVATNCGAMSELVRCMGTERRPGESGAWKQSRLPWEEHSTDCLRSRS